MLKMHLLLLLLKFTLVYFLPFVACGRVFTISPGKSATINGMLDTNDSTESMVNLSTEGALVQVFSTVCSLRTDSSGKSTCGICTWANETVKVQAQPSGTIRALPTQRSGEVVVGNADYTCLYCVEHMYCILPWKKH